MLHAHSELLEPLSSKLWNHAAGPKRSGQQLFGGNAGVSGQAGPALGTTIVALRIAAVPPHQELIGINGPARLLLAVMGLEAIKDFRQRVHVLLPNELMVGRPVMRRPAEWTL